MDFHQRRGQKPQVLLQITTQAADTQLSAAALDSVILSGEHVRSWMKKSTYPDWMGHYLREIFR